MNSKHYVTDPIFLCDHDFMIYAPNFFNMVLYFAETFTQRTKEGKKILTTSKRTLSVLLKRFSLLEGIIWRYADCVIFYPFPSGALEQGLCDQPS
jgi:hypothetical protein